MKSIFTKLSTLLLCGAVALVGCSDFSADLRDVNERLEELKESAATKAEVAALKAEVEALGKKLTDQYATKEDVAKVEATVETVQKNLKEAQDAFTAALDNKADKTALETAVKTLQDALTTAKGEFTTALEGLASANQTLKENLQTLVDKVEKLQGDVTAKLESIDGNIETLQEDLQDLTSDVDDIQKDLTSYKETVDKELKEIKEGFEKRGEELEKEFADIQKQIEDLAKNDDAISERLAMHTDKLLGEISKVNSLLSEKVAALEDADKELEAKDEELAGALEDLEDAYDQFVSDVEDEFDGVYDEIDAIWDEIDGIISDLKEEFKSINSRLDNLEDQLAELEVKVDELEDVLRSIVSVPQAMINGISSVEFKSFAFVPMTDSDELVSAEGAADAETIVPATYAYYRFNPSSFALANADYSVVSEDVVTKAAAEAVSVKNVTEEEGKVKVELVRGNGTDNMFALAATLKSNGAVVYSDYLQIVDVNLTAEDLQFVDANNNSLYTKLADAKANAAVAAINVGESFSVAEYANVAGADLAEFGLEVKYTLVNGKAELVDGVLNAVEAAEGTNNIVKAEVVDAEGCVVIRSYVNVRVIGPVTYYTATAKAALTGSRSVFAFENIETWVKELKDAPNTMELLKSSLEAIKNQNYLDALMTLGGVPGFETEYMTFDGVGSYRMKVDYTATGLLESQLEKIKAVETFDDVIALVEYVENLYQVSDLKDKVDNTVGNVLDFIVPQQYQDNQIYTWVKENIFNWGVTDLFDWANDRIVDIPLVGQVNLGNWAREKMNDLLASNSDLKNKLIDGLVDVVGKIEDAYRENVESDNAAALAAAENYAKSTALMEARIIAKAQAEDALAAKNAANVAELNDGVYGKLVALLNTDYCKEQFEANGLGEVYSVLQTVCGYVEKYVQYTEGGCDFPEETISDPEVVME